MLLEFQLEVLTVRVLVRLISVFNWMDGQRQEKHTEPPVGPSVVFGVPVPLSVLNKLDQPGPAYNLQHHPIISKLASALNGRETHFKHHYDANVNTCEEIPTLCKTFESLP